MLLSGFATATALRQISYDDLTAWLKARGVRATATLAARAKAAAESQHATVHGEGVAARVVCRIVASL